MPTDRRSFLTSTAAAALVGGCAGPRAPAGPSSGKLKDEEVTPAEDLMREHGVLRRVMYLYDDAAGRFEARREVPLDALAAGAGIVRRVIEDYHEKLEEELRVPALRAGRQARRADRRSCGGSTRPAASLTDRIVALAKAPLADADRAALAHGRCGASTTCTGPTRRARTPCCSRRSASSSARTRTRSWASSSRTRSTPILGERGFEHAVDDVTRLEQAFGLDDLAKLTA